MGSWVGWGLTGLAGSLLACAGSIVVVDGQREGGPLFRHAELGYVVAGPGGLAQPGWQRVEVEAADLAFRDASGSLISLSSDCHETRATAGALARHLTIGTARDALLAAGPVEHRGAPGWTQTFDSHEGDVALRVKAVTLTRAGCVFDFVLVARSPGPFAAAESSFDAWWPSFEVLEDARGSRADSAPEIVS